MPIESEIWDMMLANAPAVVVLIWLTYRLEIRLARCFERQGQFLDRLLEIVSEDETADT